MNASADATTAIMHEDMDAASSNVGEYTVSELAFSLKRTVEDSFGFVRVRGELSGLKRAASGHLYFALKDDRAVLDGVCWRSAQRSIAVNLEDGLEVICTGQLSTYPARSRYQLVVEAIEPAGVGALMALLEERRKKLEAEGLFETARKKTLPFLPRRIGIVTSPTGAVIRDILHRLDERFPCDIILWPVMVQGEAAADQIARAISGMDELSAAGRISKPDVLIVARGGGSIEDLWSFNEEVVVRAVAVCTIPVISAVGHETDTTLVDYAADRRAPTPTAAAEIAVPVRIDLVRAIDDLDRRLGDAVDRSLTHRTDYLRNLARGLPNPANLVGLGEQRTDELAERHRRALEQLLDRLALQAKGAGQRLRYPEEFIRAHDRSIDVAYQRIRTHLKDRLRNITEETRRMVRRFVTLPIDHTLDSKLSDLERINERLEFAEDARLADAATRLATTGNMLESLSHKSALDRGFAIVRETESGRLVRSVEIAAIQNELDIEFVDGRIRAEPIDGHASGPSASKPRARARKRSQGELF